MSLTRSFNRWVSKQTYDPQLEKQLAEEKKKAREERLKFRQSLDQLIQRDNDAIVQGKLTPLGATQSAALFKTMNDWLSATPDATADEIADKGLETIDRLANIYREDNNRLYFYSYLKVTEINLTNLKASNLISEDVQKKCQEIVDRELKWLEKNPTESLIIYKEHLQKAANEIRDVLKDPEIQKRMKDAQDGVKMEDNSKELDEQKREAERVAKEKEEREKQNFNVGRFAGKVGISIGNAILIALILSLAILGGSLSANMAVVRPLSYRILYFIYGFLFFPVVLIYFLFRYFQGFPPYFAAFLIPLYEMDPTSGVNLSFLQRLVYFKTTPVIEEARKSFQAGAEAVKDISLDFGAIAKELLSEQKK